MTYLTPALRRMAGDILRRAEPMVEELDLATRNQLLRSPAYASSLERPIATLAQRAAYIDTVLAHAADQNIASQEAGRALVGIREAAAGDSLGFVQARDGMRGALAALRQIVDLSGGAV